jgi:tetratricopeptide (TPR) repeat protein
MAHFNLARLLTKRGRLDEAAVHYRQAVRRSIGTDNTSDTLNNLGLVHSRRGRAAEAIATFRQAVRRNPRSPAPRVNGALEFFRLGDPRQGRLWLQRALELAPIDPNADQFLGYLLIEYDIDPRRGVRILKRALARSPGAARVMADLAVGYMKLGNRLKAKTFASRAKRRAPGDTEVNRQVRLVLGLRDKSGRLPHPIRSISTRTYREDKK